MLRLALSDYIDRIVDGRGLRQRVITQPRPNSEVGLRAMVRLVVSIPAIHRCQISNDHSADRMPRGSIPLFEATYSISPRVVPISISSLSVRSHKLAINLWRFRRS